MQAVPRGREHVATGAKRCWAWAPAASVVSPCSARHPLRRHAPAPPPAPPLRRSHGEPGRRLLLFQPLHLHPDSQRHSHASRHFHQHHRQRRDHPASGWRRVGSRWGLRFSGARHPPRRAAGAICPGAPFSRRESCSGTPSLRVATGTVIAFHLPAFSFEPVAHTCVHALPCFAAPAPECIIMRTYTAYHLGDTMPAQCAG